MSFAHLERTATLLLMIGAFCLLPWQPDWRVNRSPENIFREAVRRGSMALVEESGDPNVQVRGLPVLLHALRRCNWERVEQLLKRGANPNVSFPDGRSALRFALDEMRAGSCNAGYSISDMLVSYGAKFGDRDKARSYLHDMFKRRGARDLEPAALSESLPLDFHFAAHPEETPLTLALKKEDLALIKLLLDAGANPNFHAPRGLTPIETVLSLFAEQRGGKKKLSYTAISDVDLYFQILKILLAKGADPNQAVNITEILRKPERDPDSYRNVRVPKFPTETMPLIEAVVRLELNERWTVLLIQSGARVTERAAEAADELSPSWKRLGVRSDFGRYLREQLSAKHVQAAAYR